MGPFNVGGQKESREEMSELQRTPQESTVATIEMLERHAYLQITELIDGRHLDEADKIADILKKVGIV